jgi:hypothetical protein
VEGELIPRRGVRIQAGLVVGVEGVSVGGSRDGELGVCGW